MIVAPAVDLKGGRCVQLVGGRPEDEAVSLPDPVAVAERWREAGFATVHVVDLDAALGEPSDNRDVLRQLMAIPGLAFHVGGGLRNSAAVDAVIGNGGRVAIAGTRAVVDRVWLEAVALRHRGRIMVAVDAREGRVLTDGWREDSGIDLIPFLATLEGLPLAGVLFTDVGREGRLGGIDRNSVREATGASPFPLWASGGITTMDELEYLEEVGVAGAVLGMSIYTGALDAHEVARRWGGGADIAEEARAAVSPPPAPIWSGGHLPPRELN